MQLHEAGDVDPGLHGSEAAPESKGPPAGEEKGPRIRSTLGAGPFPGSGGKNELARQQEKNAEPTSAGMHVALTSLSPGMWVEHRRPHPVSLCQLMGTWRPRLHDRIWWEPPKGSASARSKQSAVCTLRDTGVEPQVMSHAQNGSPRERTGPWARQL